MHAVHSIKSLSGERSSSCSCTSAEVTPKYELAPICIHVLLRCSLTLFPLRNLQMFDTVSVSFGLSPFFFSSPGFLSQLKNLEPEPEPGPTGWCLRDFPLTVITKEKSTYTQVERHTAENSSPLPLPNAFSFSYKRNRVVIEGDGPTPPAAETGCSPDLPYDARAAQESFDSDSLYPRKRRHNFSCAIAAGEIAVGCGAVPLSIARPPHAVPHQHESYLRPLLVEVVRGDRGTEHQFLMEFLLQQRWRLADEAPKPVGAGCRTGAPRNDAEEAESWRPSCGAALNQCEELLDRQEMGHSAEQPAARGGTGWLLEEVLTSKVTPCSAGLGDTARLHSLPPYALRMQPSGTFYYCTDWSQRVLDPLGIEGPPAYHGAAVSRPEAWANCGCAASCSVCIGTSVAAGRILALRSSCWWRRSGLVGAALVECITKACVELCGPGGSLPEVNGHAPCPANASVVGGDATPWTLLYRGRNITAPHGQKKLLDDLLSVPHGRCSAALSLRGPHARWAEERREDGQPGCHHTNGDRHRVHEDGTRWRQHPNLRFSKILKEDFNRLIAPELNNGNVNQKTSGSIHSYVARLCHYVREVSAGTAQWSLPLPISTEGIASSMAPPPHIILLVIVLEKLLSETERENRDGVQVWIKAETLGWGWGLHMEI
eukprot:gene7841-5472_t